MLLQFPGRLDLVRERVGHASLRPSSWAPLLEAVEAALPGAKAWLARLDRKVARSGLTLHRAVSIANRTRMRFSDSSWQGENHPLMARGTIFRFDDIDHPARHELLAEDETAGAGLILHDCAQQNWCLKIAVPAESHEAYLPAVLTLLNRLAELFLPAFLVSHAIGSPDQPSQETIESVWDEVPEPVVLLDRDLAIGAANIAAIDIMGEARFFLPRLFPDRLALANGDDAHVLEIAVDRLLNGRRETMRVELRGLRRSSPLAVTLCRAGSPQWRHRFETEIAGTEQVLAMFQAPGGRHDRLT